MTGKSTKKKSHAKDKKASKKETLKKPQIITHQKSTTIKEKQNKPKLIQSQESSTKKEKQDKPEIITQKESSSEKEKLNKPQIITPQKSSTKKEKTETSKKEEINIPNFKPSFLYIAGLLLLFVGSLTWLIFYLNGMTQNNLIISKKINKNIDEIHRIQSEQGEIKNLIKSLQDNIVGMEKILKTVKSLDQKISDMQSELKDAQDEIKNAQNEVKDVGSEINVLKTEIKKKPDFIPPQQVIIEQISPPKTESTQIEMKEETEVKKEKLKVVEEPDVEAEPDGEEISEVKNEPEVDDKPDIKLESEVTKKAEVEEESSDNPREKVLNLIEDSAQKTAKEIEKAYKWTKGKIQEMF